MADLIQRVCPFCVTAAGKAGFTRPDGLRVWECANCGAHYISPAPSAKQIANFYANYDANHRRDAAATPAELRATYQSLGAMGDFRVRELSSLMTFEGKRALDVGFGRAHFLWCLQELGAEACGIELDDKAIEVAQALGIRNVRKLEIDALKSDEHYDLIILNDLIEHPLKPMKLLRKCVELLAPGGLLLIWTPNGAQIAESDSPVTLRVDLEHMQYLSPESCAFIATELKLTIAHLESCGFPNLAGISEARTQSAGWKHAVKQVAKSLPGFGALNRTRLQWRESDERLGAYHLFCIMRKPR